MLPSEFLENPMWYLYDTTNGKTVLKHPSRGKLPIPCPHCGRKLEIVEYKASCCNYNFQISFGVVMQVEPVALHNKTSGRGWKSLRPFEKL